MEDFGYKIKHGTLIIAAFVHECDRDLALDALSELYEDVVFEKVNEN